VSVALSSTMIPRCPAASKTFTPQEPRNRQTAFWALFRSAVIASHRAGSAALSWLWFPWLPAPLGRVENLYTSGTPRPQ